MRILMLLVLSSFAPSIGCSQTQLKGTVRDSADIPVSNATILIHWDSAGSTVGLTSNVGIKQDLVIRTKVDGTFSVELPPGFYDVFAASPAFTPTCRKIRMKVVGEVQETTFRMNADPLYIAEMGDRIEVVLPKH